MKKLQDTTNYFFVDESGDPYFYNRYGDYIVGKIGCSKILILGFIRTEKPKELRDAIIKLKNDIKIDSYLTSIPSIKKSNTLITGVSPSVSLKIVVSSINIIL